MHTNRLIDETSPYLLQHAHNPVDWYPWGPEAFEAARAANKPIFLSIGYSTCYWCHVMERESFESQTVAAVMNEHFICIKLDREERPDLDEIYMAATQIVNQGRGGWPMSVFLEPGSLRPFFAGTYFPPEQFTTLLERIAEIWQAQRDAILADAGRLAEAVTRQLTGRQAPHPLDDAVVEQGLAQLMGEYDSADGGFGRGQNKFPMPAHLDFLVGAGWSNDAVRDAVTHTLDRMAAGGLYDQVGGGFHRYSTDRQWLVPHFEKMLYDNGQLVSTYAAAYERTRDPYYARVIRKTLDYIEREMTDTAGGFWSAQDAEADAREGADYIWTADELRAALEGAGLADDVDFAVQVYGLEIVHDPHRPESEYKSVLYLRERPDVLADQPGLGMAAFNERLDRVNAALLDAREARPQPITDDKVLAGWNGLMIAGFADARRVLGDRAYAEAAARAADFVLSTMRRDDGGLLRTYRDGEAKIDAFLEDYAFMIRGLLALHGATGDTLRLDEAAALAAAAKARFWDEVNGGYYDTLADQQDLFVRTRSTYDGAVPCGNSVMLENLLDLHEATEDPAYLDDATATFKSVSATIAAQPVAMALGTRALDRWLGIYGDTMAWADAGPAPAGGEPPVRVAVSGGPLALSPDRPVSFEVTLTVADGYHINAHRPGPSFLVPLEIRVVGDGVAIDVTYPEGEPYTSPIAEHPMRVHTGQVTIGVLMEQTGAVPDRPRLLVTWQTCTDTECLPPTSRPLDLDLTIPATP